MAQHNTGRRVITAEALLKRKEDLARIKAETAAKKQIEIEKKSAFFRNTPGKILSGFSILVILFSIVFIIDGQLSKKNSTYEIKSTTEDFVQLIKGGYVFPVSFFWVYLDEQEKFGIHIHKDQFAPLQEAGKIDILQSPLFNVPSGFKTKNTIGQSTTVDFLKNYDFLIGLPILLLILSGLWLIAKPQKSLQWIMYGYFHMVLSPLIFIIFIINILAYLNGVGLYEISVSELNL